jgi:hypothetical protein
MAKKTRNRKEASIGLGLLAVSIVLGLFVLLMAQQTKSVATNAGPPLPEPVVQVTSVAPTAKPAMLALWNAYERALAAAQAEAADAQLASASTQWQAPSEEALMAGSDKWAFTFYSAAKSSVLDVIVGTDKAWVVNRTEVWDAPAVLSGENWHAGPQDVLLILLAHGARDFMAAHPQSTVELHLAQHADGYPAWNAAVVDSQNQDTFAVLVNAETMQAVSSTP